MQLNYILKISYKAFKSMKGKMGRKKQILFKYPLFGTPQSRPP